jgi:hypothetical protein
MSGRLVRSAIAGLTCVLVAGGCGAKEAQKSDTVDSTAQAAAVTADKLIVYYFHTSFRCPTCNLFEKLTKDILKEDFAAEVTAGRIELRVVNIEEEANKHFVQDYRLVTKSIILSLTGNGTEIEWTNLDKIWELVRNTAKFKEYVSDGIRQHLNKLEPHHE